MNALDARNPLSVLPNYGEVIRHILNANDSVAKKCLVDDTAQPGLSERKVAKISRIVNKASDVTRRTGEMIVVTNIQLLGRDTAFKASNVTRSAALPDPVL